MIQSCLSKKQKYSFKIETSTYALWKALEEKFLKKINQNRLYMKKRLFRFTYKPNTTVKEHIIAFNQLMANLLSLNETFKYEDLTLVLLSYLSNEFEYLETYLLHRNNQVTFNEVTSSLYSYELKKKTRKMQ